MLDSESLLLIYCIYSSVYLLTERFSLILTFYPCFLLPRLVSGSTFPKRWQSWGQLLFLTSSWQARCWHLLRESPKTAFGSFIPVHRIQNLAGTLSPFGGRDPMLHAYVLPERQTPDSGERLSPARPLDLPTPGTARLKSTPPRPPPRTGWLLSGPSAPSRPGERTRGQMSTSFPSTSRLKPRCSLPTRTPRKEQK